jgi:hypothetical protein
MRLNAPPTGLKTGGKRLWHNVIDGWEVPAEQHSLLENVCRSQDRIDKLTRIVDRQGMTQKNRFGMAAAHPAALLLRSEVANFAQLYRLLQLQAPSGEDDGVGRPIGYAPEG